MTWSKGEEQIVRFVVNIGHRWEWRAQNAAERLALRRNRGDRCLPQTTRISLRPAGSLRHPSGNAFDPSAQHFLAEGSNKRPSTQDSRSTLQPIYQFLSSRLWCGTPYAPRIS